MSQDEGFAEPAEPGALSIVGQASVGASAEVSNSDDAPITAEGGTDASVASRTTDDNGAVENHQGRPQENLPQLQPHQQQQAAPPEPDFPFLLNNRAREEEELADLRRREARVIMAIALVEYRKQGVPEEDLELILIPHTSDTNFWTRGVWFGVLVLCSFVVLIVLQVKAMIGTTEGANITFDDLMYELLDVRHFGTHAQECNLRNGRRLVVDATMPIGALFKNITSCNKGVLHIPALHLLQDTDVYPQSNRMMPFRQGVNLSWRMPCQTPNRILTKQYFTAMDGSRDQVCPMEEDTNVSPLCFRGVHDNVISKAQVRKAYEFAEELIKEGNDHFDVFRAEGLEKKLPGVVQSLQGLLADVYSIGEMETKPFAFRFLTTGPMDGYGVDLGKARMTLNEKTYVRWVRKNKRENEGFMHSLPWPFKSKPARGQCLLLSDMEADPNFSIYTSIFLSTGAGSDFRGGTTLYVDDGDDALFSSRRRSKIENGLVIDGSEGRVVVSTGGLENRRCRLPIREGLRVELQVWWNFAALG